MRQHSTHTRDSSLRKLNIINRWLIAASVILTGVLTDVAAHAFPDKKPAHPGGKATSRHSQQHSAKAHSSTPSRKLQPPAQAPEAQAESPAVRQPAPGEESAATSQAAPEVAQEPAPAREAPVEEPAAPVVSGGS
jgi:type IV secretory pathway VirB10-like protein